jgi:FHS family Na+ dependent glucose MFS transporter 1
VATRFTPRQVIPVALGMCLVLSGLLLVLPQSSALLWISAVGLGFCMAPLWPTAYTLAGQVIAMTAFASGLVLLGDSFGGMVLPSLTGKAIELAGTRNLALSLPLLVFASMVVCAVAFASLLASARRHARGGAAGTAQGGERPEPGEVR